MDHYLDALETLEFLLEKMDVSHWGYEIRKDIDAWVHRKDAQSFNDIGTGFPNMDFSIIKEASLGRYFLDIQTIAYTLSRNDGRSLSNLKMFGRFGNFGMELAVWLCNKCNILEVYSDDVERYIARHYARKDVLKHYQDASLKKMVMDRYSDDFSDIESKINFFHVLISNAGISLTKGKYHRKCLKCDSEIELTSWIFKENENQLIQLGMGDFSISQNIGDAFK
jgi:hypothetical protein